MSRLLSLKTMQAKAQAEYDSVQGQIRAIKCTADTMFIAYDALMFQRNPRRPQPSQKLTPEVQGYMDLGFDSLKIAIDEQIAQAEQLARRRSVLKAMLEREKPAAGKRCPQSQCCMPHDV